MILVAGATGNVGGALVGVLAEAGVPVRALVRTPAKASFADGVEVVTGDLDDVSTLTGPLAGVSGLFVLAGYAGLDDMLATAREAGVTRVVLLSSGSIPEADASNAVTAYHLASEAAIRGSGLEWTFLRPSAFAANALRWSPELEQGDVVRTPFPDVALAIIDPLDVAAVAAAALTEDGHAGQAYRLTGPQALTPADQLAILGAELGRELRAQRRTDEEARADMEGTMAPEYVDAFMRFSAGGEQDDSIVRPTVQDVLGRPPRTFAQWCAAHAADFARPS